MAKKLKPGKRSLHNLQIRAKAIIKKLKREYPEATTALNHSNPLELLIGTILSAQCTDKRVNMVTEELFKKYRTANDYANANRGELEQEIRSTGFYKAKTRNIINCCKALLEKFDGKVPDTMEELTQLPGVGRKTANVVLGNYFGKAEGVVVDTHVHRLSQRLGFTKHDSPEKIEQDLMNVIPRTDWIAIGNLLILHGRKTCQARKPKCPECSLNELCPSAEQFMKSM
ncbi:MAG: endonuclease III [Ignavibacteriae bacterium]|nr:endonuclease III [Ignavibacteriota bacterium]